jgi:hypothetical protein
MVGDSGLLNKWKRLSDENVQLMMIYIIMKCEIGAHKNNAIVFCITFKFAQAYRKMKIGSKRSFQ